MLLPYFTAGILLAYGIFISLKYQKMRKKVFSEEKRIRCVEQEADAVFHNINAYVILIDPNFRVQKTNYYSLNGLEEEKDPPRLGNLLHCKNAIESGDCGTHEACKLCGIRATLWRAFHKNESFTRVEATMKILSRDCKQITPCVVSVSGNCFFLNDEQRMLLTIYDISELKNTERLLRLEKENARSCDKLKNAFIANISHEVRTPLNAIVGFSSLLTSASSEEERDMYVDIIHKNNDRLLQLITDILELSQIDAGDFDYQYSEFNVNDLLRELQAMFYSRLTDHPEVMLVCDARLEELLIYSARERILQVFVTLLANAIKFTQQGEIRFGCRMKDEKEFYFYVKDTGIGISPEEQSKIFARFTKLDREIPGTGIGLTLAQTIVEKLGGKIGVESQQGEGSTFWFTLPVIGKS